MNWLQRAALYIWCLVTGEPFWRQVARVPLERIPFGPASEDPWLVAYLDLWIETPSRGLRAGRVLIDSGAPISLLKLDVATDLGLPLPPPESAIRWNPESAAGEGMHLVVRPGTLRFRFVNDPNAPAYEWAVRFQERQAPPQGALLSPPLLGLLGLVGRTLRNFRWIFDGSFSSDAPFGVLLVEIRDH